MKQYDKEIGNIFVLLAVVFLLVMCVLIIADFSIGRNILFCEDRASKFGSFFGGFLGTIFSGISLFILAQTYKQSQEDRRADEKERRKEHIRENFFRLLEAHTARVNRTKIDIRDTENTNSTKHAEGEYAFVHFKLNIHKIYIELSENNYNNFFLPVDRETLKIEMLATAYTIIFFGLNKEWSEDLSHELIYIKKHEKSKFTAKLLSNLPLGTTQPMQTTQSSYYRNMYRAIKLVDDAEDFTPDEKKDLISIYRAQLSNPELYVLACSLGAKFGKKWVDGDYIKKYQLLENLPAWQLEGVDSIDQFIESIYQLHKENTNDNREERPVKTK